MGNFELWRYDSYLHWFGNGVVGNPVTVIPPAGERWYVVGVRCSMVSDATAVNRNVFIEYNNGIRQGVRAVCCQVQAASDTRSYSFYGGFGYFIVDVIAHANISLFQPCVITSTLWLTLNAESLQAGDQFTNISAVIFRCIDI